MDDQRPLSTWAWTCPPNNSRAKVDFDADFPKHGTHKGVHVRPSTGEVYAPVAMWMESLDLVLHRLSKERTPVPMSRIRGVSGSGQQHGSVYWNHQAQDILRRLEPSRQLVDQLSGALAYEWSPNWQDQSTQSECDAFDAELGGREKLAAVTGSGAHHRFTGPQIMRLRRVRPEVYAATSRISLVSSWLASVLLGSIAPLDRSDVCGMNLWDVRSQRYSPELLALAAGKDGADDLREKLGEPQADGGATLGCISPYFVDRFGFRADCRIVPFTGDNPATMLALPLRPLDAVVSLGTSTTFLMNTPRYEPDGSYHFFNHPTAEGHYMFMLCYKNGGLAREKVRDALPAPAGGRTGWEAFNRAVLDTPPLDMAGEGGRAKLGLYFYLRETVPNVRAGTWRFTCAPGGGDLRESREEWPREVDARVIVESQALSMRLRSRKLVHSPRDRLPAQPRRIYLVGGASPNPAIARVIGDVLGGADGVYKLDVGGSACALGGAYKALWALERRPGQTFDHVIGRRWDEGGAVEKVDAGFKPATYQTYGDVLASFEHMETRLLAEERRD
ncbi:Carbohydrate kinase, FGGY [Metarhizium album ARSEF 1941]|uniref:Xylulose kinase n=1 Tax=Metarhizium album (strain ARSEF 1941) TaxID=1081103 RepID=A0A0B2X5W5_METAS|nr:Carbohydrate kinase, FGGY [Metarhizium album ARSEF 1941]KHO00701.1 Carbohydrate kinase, FGGY [Metarhizium album ARSEF 1941]